MADISFGSLMTWWNELHDVKVAYLNDNLVIQYWLHENEQNSGLSLIGTNKIDESICEIFDYLRNGSFPVKLVNVPHFVIDHVAYSIMFTFKEQRDFYEYVISLEKFYPMDNLVWYRRKKIERQLSQFGDIFVRKLDLRTEDNQKLVLDMIDTSWDMNLNNFGKLEQNAVRMSVLRAREIGIENICLFIEGKLQGICLYQEPSDKNFIILNHIKVGSKSLVGYDLMAHLFAKWLVEQGIKFANINSDAGLIRLRMLMLAFGPENFFRKYTVEPS